MKKLVGNDTLTQAHHFQTKDVSLLLSLQSRKSWNPSASFHPVMSSKWHRWSCRCFLCFQMLLQLPKELSNHSTKYLLGLQCNRSLKSGPKLFPFQCKMIPSSTPFPFELGLTSERHFISLKRLLHTCMSSPPFDLAHFFHFIKGLQKYSSMSVTEFRQASYLAKSPSVSHTSLSSFKTLQPSLLRYTVVHRGLLGVSWLSILF